MVSPHKSVFDTQNMQKLSIPHLTKGAFSLEAFSHVGYLDSILEGKVTVFAYCSYSDEASVSNN